MKKFMLVLVVLTIVLASCASPVDEVEEPAAKVNPFLGKWSYVPSGISVEISGNTWIESGTVIGTSTNYTSTYTYEYNDTYFYQYETGNISHIYVTYRYEFKENGTMLYLYWEPNVYGVETSDFVLQKIGD